MGRVDQKQDRRQIKITGVVQGVGFRPAVYRYATARRLKGRVMNTSDGVFIDVVGKASDIDSFSEELKKNPPPRARIDTFESFKLPFVEYEDFRVIESSCDNGSERVLPPAHPRWCSPASPAGLCAIGGPPTGVTRSSNIHNISAPPVIARALISPDMAVCDDCLKELFTPGNRRHLYPFINCTNCGPRFTIVKDRPYDRGRTTMEDFRMCPECRREYEDPSDRRFHAEPNACPVCGPRYELVWGQSSSVWGTGHPGLLRSRAGTKRDLSPDYHGNHEIPVCGPRYELISRIKMEPGTKKTEPGTILSRLIREGCIVAIKGLGGYHVAADPFNSEAVAQLRRRKDRHRKAFALMARDVETVLKYVHLSVDEKGELESHRHPIVLLEKKNGMLDHISPDNNMLGIMLPYTPLHHILMREFKLLIMTSANLRDEPIASDEGEIEELFKRGLIDYAFVGNREIAHKCDDSIIEVIDGDASIIRRARGYVPQPVVVKDKMKKVLALGGNLKNTFALTSGNNIFLSQHIGDLMDWRNLSYLKNQVKDFSSLLEINPERIVIDAHPDYETTALAREMFPKKEIVPVYHHYAHMVSCIVDNGLWGQSKRGQSPKKGDSPLFDDDILGIICDGTGYGTDGKIWGCEFLKPKNGGRDFERLGHMKYFPLPGGEKAIEEPWRIAITLFGTDFHLGGEKGLICKGLDGPIFTSEVETVFRMIEAGLNSPECSSLGRVFDGVAAYLGLVGKVEYEAQAAILLEAEVYKMFSQEGIDNFADHYSSKTLSEHMIKTPLPFGERIKVRGSVEVVPPPSPQPSPQEGEGKWIIDFAPMYREIASDIIRLDRPTIALKFHKTIIEALYNMAEKIGYKKVVLSGGCFQNKILIKGLKKKFGDKCYTHKQVPTNDGGISLGQAYLGGRF